MDQLHKLCIYICIYEHKHSNKLLMWNYFYTACSTASNPLELLRGREAHSTQSTNVVPNVYSFLFQIQVQIWWIQMCVMYETRCTGLNGLGAFWNTKWASFTHLRGGNAKHQRILHVWLITYSPWFTSVWAICDSQFCIGFSPPFKTICLVRVLKAVLLRDLFYQKQRL